MPEIVRIIARLNQGGPARHVIRIHAPLVARGYHTTLVTGRVGADEQDLTEQARQAGIELVLLPQLGRAPRPGSDLLALARLRHLLARRRPDLVHTHTAKAGTLGRLAAASLRERPALVHSFHGHVLKGYFGPRVSSLVAGAERLMACRTERLVAVAPRVRDELLSLGVGRAEQWDLVPPGIDGQRTRPDPRAGVRLRAELGCQPDTVLLGLVGRLAPVKDPLFAVRAFLRRRASARAHLLVVGDGALGAEVARVLRGRADATWLGPRDDLRAVWGALDLCLMCSRNEGLPQVATESLAAGVPVLATAVGGLPDLVRHEHDGLLVEREHWPAALERLLEQPGLRARLASGARGFDGSRHRAEAVAEGLVRVYERALESRVAGRATRRRRPAPFSPPAGSGPDHGVSPWSEPARVGMLPLHAARDPHPGPR